MGYSTRSTFDLLVPFAMIQADNEYGQRRMVVLGEPAVRCPKCGYVSFPGLEQCRKCGYRFRLSPDPQGKRVADSVDPEAVGFLASSTAGSHPEPRSAEPLAEFELQSRGESREDSGVDWANEVSGRVASYRQRRANLRQEAEKNLNLQFSFETETESRASTAPASGLPGGREIDLTFESRGLVPGGVSLESLPLARGAEERRRTPRPGSQNVSDFRLQAETIDASLDAADRNQAFNVSDLGCAPLSRRFLAGVVDTVVLLVAGALFAALFTLVGGKIQAVPLNLVIVVFLASFWIFVYFGLFSALTLSTPGQSAMGLALRNLEGGSPTRQESLLRAFGYLVSIASFMLGFLWAAMDSDGLAWHDHISGTMLVERNSEE